MTASERKKELQKNIGRFYLYRVFCSLTFVSPIFILFLLDNNLSMTQVMILQAVYTALTMIFTVPAGILSDKIGRKRVLIYSTFLYAFGWFVYARSYTFMGFLAAEMVMAFSNVSWQSSGSSFFYDTLKEMKEEGRFKRLYSHVISINYLTWGVAALLGGYLATFSLRLPFLFSLFPVIVSILIAFTFRETKVYPHAEKHYLSHLKGAFFFAFQQPKVRLFLIYSALFSSVGFVSYMLYQPYLKAIKIPLGFFGLIYFVFSALGALGSQAAPYLEARLGEKRSLFLVLFIFLFGFLSMSALLPIWGVLFLLIIFFFGGVMEPIIVDYINKQIESHHRATVNSLGNFLTQGVSTLLAPFIGWVVDFWSLRAAFLTSGIIVFIDLIIILIMFCLIKNKNYSR